MFTILITLYTFGAFTSAQILQKFSSSQNNFEIFNATLPSEIQHSRTIKTTLTPTQKYKNIFNVKTDNNDGKYRPQIHNRNYGNNGKYRPDDRGRYIHQHVPYDGGYGDKGQIGGKYIHNDIGYKGLNNYDDVKIESNIYNDTRFNDDNYQNLLNNNKNNDTSSLVKNLIINKNNNDKSDINLSENNIKNGIYSKFPSSGFGDIKKSILKNTDNIIGKNNNYENESESINDENNNYINSQPSFNSIRAINNNESSNLVNLLNSDIQTSKIQNDELLSSSLPSLKNRVKYDGWKIIRDNRENSPPYHYLYETENKILAEETGRLHNLKNNDNESIKAYGFYEYYGDDGQKYHIDYTADEYGYIPKGNHIHKSILKALEYQLQMAKKQ